MSVRQAQREITSAEFSEWLAYNQVQPWGPERQDWRFAQMCAILANCFDEKDHEIDEFLPKFREQKPKSSEEIKQKMRMHKQHVQGE